MKLLVAFLFISIQGFANPVSTWQNAAYGSLLEYFQSSNRIIQNLKWSNISIVDRETHEFLIEADITAKNRTTTEVNLFHCGVFARRVNAENWQVLLTTCEAFADRKR